MAQVVTFGEVMMRLSPPGKQKLLQADQLRIIYSGAEANVSVALSQWGMRAAHVTCFPNNPLGKAAIANLQKLGVDTQHILQSDGRLGLYFVEHGAMNRATAMTYDRLPSAFSTIDKHTFNWREILQGAQWFHWTGITPAISASAAEALLEALQTARAMNIRISADINYRTGLWQYGKSPAEVLAPLVEHSDVVVAAESDTQGIFGISGKDGSYRATAEAMKKRFPQMQEMLASVRSATSADTNTLGGVHWNGKEVFESRTCALENIVDRIGSGDAFIAGFIYAHLNRLNENEKIDFATASAVLKHSIEGDHQLCSVQDIKALLDGQTGGRVKR